LEITATLAWGQNSSRNDYYYQVSAVYNSYETERSNKATINTSGLEAVDAPVEMFPTAFSNSVIIKGFENINRIEVFSATGKLSLSISRPSSAIDTSGLSSGFYFFRITLNNGAIKTVKGVKN
jgi:hypothetical protein